LEIRPPEKAFLALLLLLLIHHQDVLFIPGVQK